MKSNILLFCQSLFLYTVTELAFSLLITFNVLVEYWPLFELSFFFSGIVLHCFWDRAFSSTLPDKIIGGFLMLFFSEFSIFGFTFILANQHAATFIVSVTLLRAIWEQILRIIKIFNSSK